MRRLIAVLLLAGVAIFSWGAAQTRPSTRPAAPDKLLLLDDEEPKADDKLLADNSRCHVCHMNFAMEELSVTHAKKGVGCAKCHGESDAHIADESWASGGNGTAPDIMYPREKINAACMNCHKEKFDAVVHKLFLDGKTEQKHCTECHGKHKMAIRKCKWK